MRCYGQRVSDERVRELERRFRQSGDSETEQALLRERLRLGQVTRERLAVAAFLEHEPALALVERWTPESDELSYESLTWLRGLTGAGVEVVARAAALVGRLGEPLWRAESAQELGPRLSRAVRELDADDLLAGGVLFRYPGWVVEAWARDPTPARRVVVRQVAAVLQELAETSPAPLAALARATVMVCQVVERCAQVLADEPLSEEEDRSMWSHEGQVETSAQRSSRRAYEAVMCTHQALKQVAACLAVEPSQFDREVRAAMLAWLCGHADPLAEEPAPFLTVEQLEDWSALPSDLPVTLESWIPWRVSRGNEEITDPEVLEAYHNRVYPSSQPLSQDVTALGHVLYGGELRILRRASGLRGRLTFVAPRPLKRRETLELERYIRGELSHGFGGPLRVADPRGQGQWLTLRAAAETASVVQRSTPGVDRTVFPAPGVTALLEAASEGDLARVEALLAEGVDAGCRDRYGVSAAERAIKGGHRPVLAALLARIPPEAELGAEVMYAVLRREQPELLEDLLAHGANPNASSPTGSMPGQTALMEARRIGNDRGFERLLAAGADLDHPADDGRTILHWACSGRWGPEVLSDLLRRGADPTRRDQQGRTPRDLLLERIAAQHRALAVSQRQSDREKAQRAIDRAERLLELLPEESVT